jgi:hypothetical protein
MANDAIVIDILQDEKPSNRAVNVAYEPRRTNRFIVDFPYMFNIPSYTVKKINKPKLTFKDNTYVWSNILIEFIDLIGPSTSRGIFEMIQFCKNYQIAIDQNQPLFNFTIIDLDPTGVGVGTWTIEVKEISSVDFGDCEYDNPGLQICKLSIKPLNCTFR